MMRLAFLLIFICCMFGSDAQEFNLFIGTYTGTGSKGIYVYRFNSANGNFDWISNTDSIENPSYLTLAHGGTYLYAVNETNGNNPGRLSAFHFDKNSGKLKLINSQLTGGDDPCYVSLSKDDKFAVVANYSGGNIAVFPIKNDGSLEPFTQLINDTGSSVNIQRQEKAHVHAAIFSPQYDYLFTPDLGTDKLMIYKFVSRKDKPLQPAPEAFISSIAGSGPRHFTFHPNKKLAYLIEELNGTVSAYKYYDGSLTFIQRIITHPENYKGAIGSADIHLSPDGKFLYASNRGDENSITIFAVNSMSGKLTKKGYQSSLGKTPRNFIIDPIGNYLLVANQDSDNIVIYKRNKKTGALQPLENQIKIPSPVCLQMSK